ncbi:nuclease-related domain-containing DEAD/DEAH box helicase [Fretibacterium sp. OH1220_COT-178]|uniref:nuclease-related domain-containing DEAD/DEAH box helicase n=1 Tax=Fretibacterium sp. OH1220_COT-178 TaxID=2491047 RepID=UPI000F5EAF09|nr:NERD domain-containing protein [Fretibacterium sp. OH1220_COT-178]RRD63899.1 DUF2075 domain-containing protein [Fretibacterium sp. OH1220_COT-178]
MARMIPSREEKSDFNGSYGEEQLFHVLKEGLPPSYVVFHSIAWHHRDEKGRGRWGEADYVIFNPARGLLVLEVKSGQISCDDTGMIVQTNTMTHEQQRIRPMQQAQKSVYIFVDLLDGELEPGQRYWIEPIVWFPSVSRETFCGHLPNEYSQENVFFEEDLKEPLKALEKAYDYYNMSHRKRTDESIAKVIDKLAPCFRAIPSLASIYSEQEFYFNRMTREQGYLLDYLEEQQTASIQGAAGTGKTMLALEKARRLSDNEQVLFLCFNKLLLSFLKKTFKENLPNVYFYNLQSMASQALNKEASLDDVSDFLLDYKTLWGEWKYKSIIIDEGQDFQEEHIQLLKEIADFNKGSFYVFYDKHQLVHQNNNLGWVKDIECRLILSMNCRNTKSIAETAGLPLNISGIRMRKDILGQRPSFYIVDDNESAKRKIAALIREYTDHGMQQKQIVILTQKTLETSILTGCTSVGNYKLKSSFEEKGVLFTTAKKFKGLESDVVIMIDLTPESFAGFERRKVFYVGASRAKHFLNFIAVLSPEGEDKLAESLTGEKKRATRMAIMNSLRVKIRKV